MSVKPQRVRDFMTPAAIQVTPEIEIMKVIALLVERDISGLPVVDDSGALVGFVTERDCIRIALQSGYLDEIGGPVSDYMTRRVHCVHPEDSMMDVGELFAASPFRRCPVVENGILIGLISRRDVLRALTQSSWFQQR
ncbi:MAG: CBS domain-containing protein [Pseudomonadales bacterium]|nr:CBS domain-containing protein [Pseudomonadales bacterium]